MTPRIILDENVNSKKLRKNLKSKGFKTIFLGQGVQDIDIERFMEKDTNTVLITADIELDSKFPNNRSFLVGIYDKPHILTTLIIHYMSQFIKNGN